MTSRAASPPDRPVPSPVVQAAKAGRAASEPEDPGCRMERAFQLGLELARFRAVALSASGFTAAEIDTARKRRGRCR